MVHVTDVPLTRHGNAFYATIAVNGGAALMLVDTGAALTVVTDQAARRLHLFGGTFRSESAHGIGGYRGVGVGSAKDLQLGTVHARNTAIRTVESVDEGPGVDGILGMDYLSSFDLDLDFWGGRLGLYKALRGCRAPSAALGGKLFGADMVDQPYVFDDPSPSLDVSINGQSFHAQIDTGAFHTTIFRGPARRAGLDHGETLGTIALSGFGADTVESAVRISTPVEVGDLTVRNMPIVVADYGRMPGVDILLGYDFVTRVHVWISHSSHSIIMQYPPTASPPPPS